MNLKNLSNSDLHGKLILLTTEERKLTLEVLCHLREVEKRRLYSERGHSSLFEYAVSELKYSESAAQRRIFAMRALKEFPELETKVESGELKVTQLAQIQSFFRAENKSGKPFSLSQKRELIESTIGKSTRETEKILAVKNPAYAERERIRVLSPTQTQLTFTADEELMQNFQSIRDRFAHRLPAGASLAEVVRFMAKITLESAPENKKEDLQHRSLQKTKPLPAPVAVSRYISVTLKKEIWKRDQGKCTFVSKTTGKKCESKHRLEIDHITPFALNGSSTDSKNLRLLCFAHNQSEATRVQGYSYKN